MKELGQFDGDHEMFVRKPVDPNLDHLRFLRFQAERGDFGPKPLSVPKGDYVFRLSSVEIKKYALQEADKMPDSKLRQHLAASGDY